jgi:hypothetical protein
MALHVSDCPMTNSDQPSRTACVCDGYPVEWREVLEGGWPDDHPEVLRSRAFFAKERERRIWGGEYTNPPVSVER